MGLSALDRFMSHVSPEPMSGCWLWTGSFDKRSRGRIGIGIKTSMLAHRVSFELFNNAPAGNLCVCHRCDNPSCVNPGHLFLGTQQKNMDDMNRKGRGDTAACRRAPKPAMRGDLNGHASLIGEMIAPIIMTHRAGVSLKTIGRWFGVSPQAIWLIVKRKTWAHISTECA